MDLLYHSVGLNLHGYKATRKKFGRCHDLFLGSCKLAIFILTGLLHLTSKMRLMQARSNWSRLPDVTCVMSLFGN
jgi:hypothetical protein